MIYFVDRTSEDKSVYHEHFFFTVIWGEGVKSFDFEYHLKYKSLKCVSARVVQKRDVFFVVLLIFVFIFISVYLFIYLLKVFLARSFRQCAANFHLALF